MFLFLIYSARSTRHGHWMPIKAQYHAKARKKIFNFKKAVMKNCAKVGGTCIGWHSRGMCTKASYENL